MSLTEDDVQKILRVLDELDYGDIRLEIGELKLHLRKHRPGEPMGNPDAGPPAPEAARASAQPTPHAVSSPVTAGQVSESPIASASWHVVQAPISGVFYRAPGPGQEPFVSVGQQVTADDTVCLLEVMKLFQSVSAGASGRVAAILAENGDAVSAGQALLSIEAEE